MKKRVRNATLMFAVACAIPIAALTHRGWSEYESANASFRIPYLCSSCP